MDLSNCYRSLKDSGSYRYAIWLLKTQSAYITELWPGICDFKRVANDHKLCSRVISLSPWLNAMQAWERVHSEFNIQAIRRTFNIKGVPRSQNGGI